MKPDSIEDLKEKIAELESQSKARGQRMKTGDLVIRILIAAGHIDEDDVTKARDLAESKL